MTDTGDAPNNACAIDRAAVPSAGSSAGIPKKDGVGATLVGSDGNVFVEEVVEALDTSSSVVATSSNMKFDTKERTKFFEEAFEGAAMVDDNQAAKPDFQKNVSDQRVSKVMGGGVIGGSDENKAGEITRGTHKMSLAATISNLARGPDVNVEDTAGTAEGPGKDELAVANDSSIGSNAVRALEDPTRDVISANRPKEAETDAVRTFANARMTSRRGGALRR